MVIKTVPDINEVFNNEETLKEIITRLNSNTIVFIDLYDNSRIAMNRELQTKIKTYYEDKLLAIQIGGENNG